MATAPNNPPTPYLSAIWAAVVMFVSAVAGATALYGAQSVGLVTTPGQAPAIVSTPASPAKPSLPELPQAPATKPAAPVAKADQPPAVAVQPPKRRFPRGATPTPRAKIFAAAKHVPRAAPAFFVPAVIPTPAQMSYWGNQTYGDCCTAEECFAKLIWSVYFSPAAVPLDFPESLAIQWAGAHGFLDGADLTTVMEVMASVGMTYNGATYTDGPYTSVDFMNWATLTSAISQGPLKIGVASSQFDDVTGVGVRNGWVMTGFQPDGNEDHDPGLCGYGTMGQLATALGVTLPAGVNPSANGLLMFTWDSIGIIDYASLQNITAEAWLRTPTTPQMPAPAPVPPTPLPTPTPPPAPTPTPCPCPCPPSPIPSPTPIPAPTPVPPAPAQVTIQITGGSLTGTMTESSAPPKPSGQTVTGSVMSTARFVTVEELVARRKAIEAGAPR